MNKLIFLNFLIFFILLFLLETSIFIYRYYNEKLNIGFFKTGDLFSKIEDDCERMKSHPILGHVHDHNNKCDILDGALENDLVAYNSEDKNLNVIITLGGSTTDGFYKNFSQGKTYPFYLNKLCRNEKKCRVVNAGVGGYGSSKELLKLITRISSLKYNISHIISLNGINDIEGYSNKNLTKYLIKPFLDSNQVYMLDNQKWIIKNKKPFMFFPNIMSLFYNLEMNLPKKSSSNQNLIVDKEVNSRFKDNTDVWFFNVKTMKAVADTLGAKYFVFLQPTIGLLGEQSKIEGLEGNDKKILSEALKNKIYIKNLRKTYKGLKEYCNNLPYCFDISNLASPSSAELYSNSRHHNQKGNKIIAEKIFDLIYF